MRVTSQPSSRRSDATFEVSAVASILEVIANPEQATLGLREILRSRRSEDQIEGQEKILGEGVEKHRRNHHHCHTPIQK